MAYRHPLPTDLSTRENAYQCKLSLNKYSARGVVADYQLVLAQPVFEVERVIEETEDLFIAICTLYTDYSFKVRLVALCEYERFNIDGGIIDSETYHHASAPSEHCSIWLAKDFYREHMHLIANRIDTFLRNGSSLRFVGYKHIHVAISVSGPIG